MSLRLFGLAAGLAVTFTSMLAAHAAEGTVPSEGFVALFNGQDLVGWHGMPHFDPRMLAAMADDERARQIARWTEDAKAHWTAEGGELVNAHTGPVLQGGGARAFAFGGDNPLTIAYGKGLPAKLAESVRLADKAMRLAKVAAGHGEESAIRFNRRFHMTDGPVGWNPGKLNPKILKGVPRLRLLPVRAGPGALRFAADQPSGCAARLIDPGSAAVLRRRQTGLLAEERREMSCLREA